MRQLLRWAVVVTAVVVSGYFLLVDGDAKNIGASITRVPIAAPPPSSLPRIAVAASRGVQELVGSGDRSPVGWHPRTGLWGGHSRPNWWQSALALRALLRYLERTDNQDPAYQRMLLRIYQRNIYKPHSAARREFANEFMDDTAWWGLAWLEASRYELSVRHDRGDASRFLAVAEWDAAYIAAAPKQCGGIVWALRRAPDAVTSAEFVDLAAELYGYRTTPGIFYDPQRASIWLADARSALGWLKRIGLVDFRDGYVLDRLNGGCHRFIGGPLTYTEGELAEALTQMGIALHDPAYFRQAAAFLRYTFWPRSGLVANGILQEHCEVRIGRCHAMRNRLDIPAFKGVFIQAVYDWTAATGRKFYVPFLRRQAEAVVSNAIFDRHGQRSNCGSPARCQFAFDWGQPTGASEIPITVASQTSALEALTAILPQTGAKEKAPARQPNQTASTS
jgi:hypothetical protein